jgi:tRNA pseudouridine55 synthase
LDGIINIYKQKGYTSHDVVAVVRKTLNYAKVGHTGTLDPEAEGVLPICIGKATKIAEYLTCETKRYEAEVTLGITTTTEDHTGEIVEQNDVNFDTESIQKAVASFIGDYLQTPPMYSAIKVGGKKLYELAREGKTVERKSRKITIFDIHILEYLPPNKIKIDVICSKGTYIRTLCVDIGQKLGCGAHMSALLRTQSGKFLLKDSITLDQLKSYRQDNKLEDILLSMDKALSDFPKIVTRESCLKALYNGNIIYAGSIAQSPDDLTIGQQVLVYDYVNKFVGIYKVFRDDENKVFIKPVKLLI